MSKAEVKKYIKSLERGSLEELMMDLYSARKEATEFLADLMLYIPECACEIANDWGDMWEQFYDAAGNNFKAAMKYISEHQLQSQFQKRIDIILQNCESSGWGFPDAMWDIYYEYSDVVEEG